MKQKIKVGVFTATCLLCANMIGTGVFTSLGYQLQAPLTGFEVGLLWLLGGVISLLGAFSYRVLIKVVPKSGGEYTYLRAIYSEKIGLLTGLFTFFAGFAAPIAASAIAFAAYLKMLLPSLSVAGVGAAEGDLVDRFLALVLIFGVSFIHVLRKHRVAQFQNVFVVLKVLGISAFTGFLLLKTQNALGFHWLEATDPNNYGNIFSSKFAISIVFVIYSYSGWNAPIYIAEDIRNPHQTIPKAIFIGTILVTLIYFCLNIAFYYSTPRALLQGHKEVAFIAAQYVFGTRAGLLVGGLIAMGLASSVSSMIWSGAKVLQTMAIDTPAIQRFARLNRNEQPYLAVVALTLVSGLLVLTSSYQYIIQYIGVALTLSSFFSVLGIFVLWRRQKGPQGTGVEAPFKIALTPWSRLCCGLFLFSVLGILLFVAFSEPSSYLATGVIVIVGSAFHEWSLRKRGLGQGTIIVPTPNQSPQVIDRSA